MTIMTTTMMLYDDLRTNDVYGDYVMPHEWIKTANKFSQTYINVRIILIDDEYTQIHTCAHTHTHVSIVLIVEEDMSHSILCLRLNMCLLSQCHLFIEMAQQVFGLACVFLERLERTRSL